MRLKVKAPKWKSYERLMVTYSNGLLTLLASRALSSVVREAAPRSTPSWDVGDIGVVLELETKLIFLKPQGVYSMCNSTFIPTLSSENQ